MNADEPGETTELVERRFEVAGMPRLRVRNVSGQTEIAAGGPGEVLVTARKRMRGWSEDRARRLLENVEIRMEQEGDEIVIEPRIFEQERGWLDLFRGGRVVVDLEIRVPREAQVDASTVSGQLSLTGTRGPMELRSVSGEVTVRDVQGPLRVRTVSGDVLADGFVGQLEANSVSGDMRFERSRVRLPDIVTVSGDLEIDALPAGDGRVKTVSGDVALGLAGGDVEIEYRTLSGDAAVEVEARVEQEGRRDRHILLGRGGPQLRVKTVSGDLKVRAAREAGLAEEMATAAETTVRTASRAAEAGADARAILERLARGELSVDDAAAALDTRRGA